LHSSNLHNISYIYIMQLNKYKMFKNPIIRLSAIRFIVDHMQMVMQKKYDRIVYYGRGPAENYKDRKSHTKIGLYEQYRVPYKDYTFNFMISPVKSY